MRLRFLGTGTSSGVPAIGCDCAVCTSDDPRDQRLRTSACLEFTDVQGCERVILIDAGPDLRQQALAAGLKRCDAVLLTHNHVDHCFGLDELRRFNVLMDGPIDVLADAHTLKSVRRVYGHIFDRARRVNDSFVATLIPREVRPAEPFELFGLRITPIQLLHGRLPVLGFRFDNAGHDPNANGLLPLAYCTDVSAIPPETWAHLVGLRVLVLDALRHRRHPTHFTVAEAENVAARVGAGRTYFVHMSHDLCHAETDATLSDAVHLAYDGLVLG
ncbi:MAG: MBL fold metallo-hydrolase [Phycisphaeraceae bacterium]|nr:MAG: MBL fold metallo-hydrolase [Phycisphaeraceae bacterium]